MQVGTKKGDSHEDGLNRSDGSDPGGAPADEPPEPSRPRQSAEPWRQAALAWTQHAEAWAVQTEALAQQAADRAAAETSAAPAETANPDARAEAANPTAPAEAGAAPPATPAGAAPSVARPTAPVAPATPAAVDPPEEGEPASAPTEPHGWVAPTPIDTPHLVPLRTHGTTRASAAAPDAPARTAAPTGIAKPDGPVRIAAPGGPVRTAAPGGPEASDVDDLGETPDAPLLSPWPDLAPDERSAHPHVWASPRTNRRSWAPLAGAAAFVLSLATASVAVWSWTKPAPTPLSAPAPPLASAPVRPAAPAPALTSSASPEEGAASAPVVPAPTGGRPETDSARPADKLAAWADALRRLDIPPVALQSYGYAEAVLARAKPGCHLSWTLLAGIGAVESNHGRYGGAVLQPDGTSSRPIIGVPLAGVGVERVSDTDQGLLDGDVRFDRAIGPMQFLPSTWKSWAVDADGNGRADPYDIDDAALAAGYYLCAGGADLASGSGWSSAVFSYNRVPAYVRQVYDYADAYGRAS